MLFVLIVIFKILINFLLVQQPEQAITNLTRIHVFTCTRHIRWIAIRAGCCLLGYSSHKENGLQLNSMDITIRFLLVPYEQRYNLLISRSNHLT